MPSLKKINQISPEQPSGRSSSGQLESNTPSAIRLRRKHGLQSPLHPLQLCGWLVLTVLIGGSFLLLVPGLPLHAQPAAATTISVLLLIHLISHLIAALIDPAEPLLRQKKIVPLPQLDRTKHTHVIEGGFCFLCQIEVTNSKTKHCSICNKCVANFDHHCKWLNHCIGGRNYASFLMCVSSAVAAAALVAVLAITNFVYYQIGTNNTNHIIANDFNQDLLNITNSSLPKLNSTASISFHSSLPTSDAAFLAIVAALGLLAAVTAGLLLHLCFFHIYISFLGLTTYEYIRQQRETNNHVPVTINPIELEQVNESLERNGTGILRHRPVNLQCENKTRTFFSCSVLEQTFSTNNNNNNNNINNNSSSKSNSTSEPTPTPPTTPQDCQMCIMGNNSVVPEIKQTSTKKIRKKWNCCISVPDSPDDIHSPNEPRCLISLCRHNVKNKKVSPVLEGRSHRTSAKIRLFFRVIGNLGQNKRHSRHSQQMSSQKNGNPGIPSSSSTSITTVSNLVPVGCAPNGSNHRSTPTIGTPPRRRFISETELANALTLLQQQQQRCGRRPTFRRRRRSIAHRTKTPALSPIHESGLSNPASPSRQSCTITGITGSCTRPT